MKVNRISSKQIVKFFKGSKASSKVEDICQHYGISEQTLYDLLNMYESTELDDIIQIKTLEEENRQLKLVANDLRLHNETLRNLLDEVPVFLEEDTTIDYDAYSFEMNNQKKVYH
jgi:AraC-like DNA-binding protein